MVGLVLRTTEMRISISQHPSRYSLPSDTPLLRAIPCQMTKYYEQIFVLTPSMNNLVETQDDICVSFHAKIVREQLIFVVDDQCDGLSFLVVVQESSYRFIICKLIPGGLSTQLSIVRMNGLGLATTKIRKVRTYCLGFPGRLNRRELARAR